MRLVRAALILAFVLFVVGVPGTSNAQAVDNPTVTGPIIGGLRGHALWDSWFELSDLGYMEEEYFLSAAAPAGGLCGGAPCWRKQRSGFRYRDGELTPDGLATVVLKEGPAAKARIVAKGKGGPLAMPALPIADLPVVVQLSNSAGQCWEARYGSTVRNTTQQFKARAD